MYTFGASSFRMAGSRRSSVNDVQRRSVGFSWTLLVVLLFSLFPAASSSQETAGNRYRTVEVSQSQKAGSSTEASSGPDILSDTRGVDFGPYIKQVVKSTNGAWMKVIPESARPPQSKQGRVGIRFKIDPMGRVSGMLLENPSGDIGLDRAAWGGITGASPYPPLPAEFTGPYLELRFGFFYNLDPKKIGPAN
jgi:TonB family protein